MLHTRVPDGQPPLPEPLVGRDSEQRILGERLTALQAGQGSVVLVAGEAGIGKTALCEELARAAHNADALVLSGHCYDLTAAAPYELWLTLTASPTPTAELPALDALVREAQAVERHENQAAYFNAVVTALRTPAVQQPVVLLLEDLHWSDGASLELLRVIARQAAGLSLLVVCTYRNDALGRRHPLYALTPLLVSEAQAEWLDLERLERTALRELTLARYPLSDTDAQRLVAFLDAQAEGNPLYTRELLRVLERQRLLMPGAPYWQLGELVHVPVPPLVRQFIDRRLAALDQRTRALLVDAAVIGQVVPLDLWQAVAGADDDVLTGVVEQAVEAHVLEDAQDGQGLRFTHALIRESVYESAVLPLRRARHRRVAAALRAQSQAVPDTVAHHLERAGDPAAEWWLLAGEQAQARYAAAAALERFTRALDAQPGLTPPDRRRAYRARGRTHETVGAFERAVADQEAALALARGAGERDEEWQTLLDLGMLWASRDYDRTESYYRQALELARAAGDELLVARSLNRLGNWQLNMDWAVLARSIHEEALAVFRAADDRRGVAETLDFLGMDLVLCGDLPQATAYYREAVDLFRVLDDRHGMVLALATMTERAATIGDQLLVPAATLAESLHDAEAALAIAREAGLPADEAYALVHVLLNLAGQGQLGRSFELTAALAQVLEQIDHSQWQTGVHTMLGLLHLMLLDGGAARYHFERAVELSRQGRSRFGVRMYGSHLALALVCEGSLDEVEPLLDGIFGADDDLQSITQLIALLARAELALARGDAHLALAAVTEALALTPNAGAERMPVWPAIIRGEALAAAGRLDEAEAALRAAMRDAVQQGARNRLWRAQLALGSLYLQQGRQAAAERELVAARALVAQLADTLNDFDLRGIFLTRAYERFPEAPPVQRRPDRSPGLSPRELEVLCLLAEGCSDREVAEALAISHRTAMTHVANILNKLGVNSRTAAVSRALRQGII